MKIEINNLYDVINKFNHELLSEEFVSYLVKECKMDNNDNITLNIESKLTKEEQNILTNTIHHHFKVYYEKAKKIDKYDNYVRLILLIMGIILILISEQFNNLLEELFLIAGWVIVWEIVYDVFFSQVKRKTDKKIYKMLSDIKINYV